MRRREVRTSESIFLDIRGLRYHCRCWGDPQAPKLFLLHGWMDVSASFQFLVDAFRGEWRAIAPDWRGYGLTAWGGADGYWFPDYLGRSRRTARAASRRMPRAPDRPQHGRQRRLSLCRRAAGACGRSSSTWKGSVCGATSPRRRRAGTRRGSLRLPSRSSSATTRVSMSSRRGSSRPIRDSPAERARFLAEHWGAATPESRVALRSDPAHKRVNPVLYRVEEAQACWRKVTAPVLWVEGEESESPRRLRVDSQSYDGTQALLRDARRADDCGRRTHAPPRSTPGGRVR